MKLFLDSCYLAYLRYAADDRIADYVTSLLRHATDMQAELVTNMIAIDEAVWLLVKKYGVPQEEVFELVNRLLPLLSIVPLDSEDYASMKQTMLTYSLRPSDSLHIASVKKSQATYLVSEDKDFDKIPTIKRLWLDVRARQGSSHLPGDLGKPA